MTIGEAVASVAGRLSKAGVESPQLEAQMLVAHSMGAERAYVLAHAPDPFTGKELDALCERRAAREPLAYILGWREFYGRRFLVTPDVLIPRQETETLIEVALRQKYARDVLDVGTGSGCIAITLALEKPDWNVAAVDVSEAALSVARRNVERYFSPLPSGGEGSGVRGACEPELLKSDLFSALVGRKFDAIVSNPPYVAEEDALPPEVKDHEPHLALYAEGDGLAIYQRLAREAHSAIKDTGVLIVELGDGAYERAADVFEREGWHVESVAKDLSGTDRVLVLRPLVV
ncbi:MAG TPA: peptide chain release factor N(5)-glutamine methyltransferase [Fimbriimonadaceae bacterium]|nr:peptide chain release factor N(5)-glutamine methyltransferase [Fimbriimonadaceae bacterium]